MDTIALCHAEADDCLRRANTDTNENDKPLWATLAQSWLQLAEQANAEQASRVNNDVSAQLERAVEEALS
jgi:hypothetical protein